MIMGTTLKRYVMPKFWNVPIKTNAFIVKPLPGPHGKNECIPLQIILRDMLKLAHTAKEVRQVLNAEKVLVDKKVRKQPKYPVGLMDVVEIPSIGKSYRIEINKKGLYLANAKDDETNRKLCRITGKTTIKGGLTQLNLHDGRNIILKKDAYGVGDSLLIQIPDQKILKHFKLQKDEHALIISGKNIGAKGKIHEIKRRKTMLETSTVVIKSGEESIETLLDYVMVGEL
jgi:small subunit ribosomal protein S4e